MTSRPHPSPMAKLSPDLVKPAFQHGNGSAKAPAPGSIGVERSVSRQYEFAGKSGARYRYSALEEERFLPPAGANYVIARVTKDGATLVFAGETDNLANQTWRKELDKARETYRDARMLTRLNVTRAVREAERHDLIQ